MIKKLLFKLLLILIAVTILSGLTMLAQAIFIGHASENTQGTVSFILSVFAVFIFSTFSGSFIRIFNYDRTLSIPVALSIIILLIYTWLVIQQVPEYPIWYTLVVGMLSVLGIWIGYYHDAIATNKDIPDMPGTNG